MGGFLRRRKGSQPPLDEAIDLLPPAKLHKIVRKYLDLKRLHPDSEKATKASLLANVKAFEKASLAGEYYESFDVNSKNFMEQSRGTTHWIAEFRRLLGWDVLRSTLWAASVQDGAVRFEGRGWGHGVGLSQYGAKGMAERGYAHAQILAHYYPGSTLGPLK